MARKVVPLANRILVRKEAIQQERRVGALYIPDSAQEKGGAVVGDVIDVGEGIFNEKGEFIRKLHVEKGQKVVFGKYAGIEVVLNEENLLLMEEVDVIGVVIDEPA